MSEIEWVTRMLEKGEVYGPKLRPPPHLGKKVRTAFGRESLVFPSTLRAWSIILFCLFFVRVRRVRASSSSSSSSVAAAAKGH